jgi:ribonuclease BN (tRNA processing enzyme)
LPTLAFSQAPSAATAKASGSTLVLLGTQGGPNVNLGRSQAANAVIVDGRPYLVDCGYGTLRALVQAGIPYNDVTSVFLTHLHDDHTTDVAALLSHKWTGGRAQATTVYGPQGTSGLVDGALAYLKANADIRTTDEGRTEQPESVFRGRNLGAGMQPAEVFRDDRVTVLAVENAHFPDRARARMSHRSLAYRFTAGGRSFVFSGDTAYSKGLVELARGADIFVCEAIDTALHQQLEKTAQATEAKTGNPNSIARHVVETHSTTEDVGRMAAEAKVKTVVLSHLLPGSNAQRGPELPDTAYIAGVKKHFDGEVIVGRDQMRL